MIPPAIFGKISESKITLDQKLEIPEDDAEIEALADKYGKWANSLTRKLLTYPRKETLIKGMTMLKGERYPEEEWWTAAEARQRAIRDDTYFIIDSHCTNRIYNAANDYDQLNEATKKTHRSYNSYVLALSKRVAEDNITQSTRDIIQLPVGEYGPEAAEKLGRIVVWLNDFIKTSSVIEQGVRERMDEDQQSLLTRHTARSKERHEAAMEDHAVHGVKNTLTEGILSIAQVISLLTARKIDGYTHDELVEKIFESDIVEQFTRLTHPGYIGPISLSGLYLADAMQMRNEKPVLSKEAMATLGEMRKREVERTMARWALYDQGKGEQPAMLGLVCPAAAPRGAISMTKNVIKPFYTHKTHA